MSSHCQLILWYFSNSRIFVFFTQDENLDENEFGEVEDSFAPCGQENIVLERNLTKLTIAEFYAPSPAPVKTTGQFRTGHHQSCNSTSDGLLLSDDRSNNTQLITDGWFCWSFVFCFFCCFLCGMFRGFLFFLIFFYLLFF